MDDRSKHGSSLLKDDSYTNHGVVLEADLSRGCYFAGDIIEAQISFYFPGRCLKDGNDTDVSVDTDTDTEDGSEVEFLEWATAQVHGHVSYDPQLVSPGPSLLYIGSSSDTHSLEILHEETTRTREEVAPVLPMTPKKGSTARNNNNIYYNSMATPDRRLLQRTASGITLGHRSTQLPSAWEDTSLSGSMPDVVQMGSSTGFCIFASPPEVLVCAKKAKHGQTLNYMLRLRLPEQLPPTYRILGREKLIRPINLPSPSSHRTEEAGNLDSDYNYYDLRSGESCNHDFEMSSWSVDEFMKKVSTNSNSRFTSLPAFTSVGLRVLDTDYLARRRVGYYSPNLKRNSSDNDINLEHSPNGAAANDYSVKVYRIGSEALHMARLTMYRQSISPGETLLISLDFQNAKVKCVQVTVGIETEEKRVQPPPLRAAFVPLTSKIGNHGGTTGSSMGSGPWRRVTSAEHAIVAASKAISMKINIPTDATPDFSSELVTVRSYLRFEFVTGHREQSQEITKSTDTVNSNLPILNKGSQVCPWRIPLTIIPPTSLHNKSVTSLSTNENEVRASTMLEMNSIGVKSNFLRRRVWL